MSDEENYLFILDRIKTIRQGEICLLSSDGIPHYIVEYDTILDLTQSEKLTYLDNQLKYYPQWEWEAAYDTLKSHFDELF